jgi:ligand-binding sensor domain-containing protein
MISAECKSPHFTVLKETPDFGLTKSIPSGLSPQIEKAVEDFIRSSHMPQGVDWNGFYHQTLQSIAHASVLGGQGDLWLGTLNGDLVIYILAHINNDFDGRLAYTVTQAWVREDQRGQRWVKEAWQKVRQRAKDCLCKHFVAISSLGKTEAYCRFLGKGFHKYAEILKEEI